MSHVGRSSRVLVHRRCGVRCPTSFTPDRPPFRGFDVSRGARRCWRCQLQRDGKSVPVLVHVSEMFDVPRGARSSDRAPSFIHPDPIAVPAPRGSPRCSMSHVTRALATERPASSFQRGSRCWSRRHFNVRFHVTASARLARDPRASPRRWQRQQPPLPGAARSPWGIQPGSALAWPLF